MQIKSSALAWARVSGGLAVAGIVGACSSASGTMGSQQMMPQQSGGAAAGSFERVAAPFSVLDATGEAYTVPFLGGLDVPRPQFVDIDGDEDFDLFLQEKSGQLMFFENVGTTTEADFVWRTDRFQDLDIGEWNRFVDFDLDGDMDLFAETRSSYVRYFRNDGTATEPSFVLHPDSVRTDEGSALFIDRQNIPYFTDLDCDGLLDLFVGRVEGTIWRYEQTSDSQGSDVPAFRLLSQRWENIEIIGQLGTLKHGANAMAFVDVDNDGDLDLLWGDWFEPSILLIENTGTCQRPVLRSEPVPLPVADSLLTSGYNAPFPADIDGDGDWDLFVGVLGGAFGPNRTHADNFYLYESIEGQGLTLQTRRYLKGVDVGAESIPTPVDWDGDGDLDLLVSNKLDPSRTQTATTLYFENVGSGDAPTFQVADTLDFGKLFHYAPAMGDLDGDGDLDMMLGTWSKNVRYMRNDGSREAPSYALVDSTFVSLPRGSNATPTLGDIDGDGDLDLLVGEASGTLNFFENEGTTSEPNFVLVTEEYADIDTGRRSFPQWVDADADGDLDLLLGAESGDAALYRNEGTASEAVWVQDESFNIPIPSLSSPTMADLDGDGILDVISGETAGGIRFFKGR